MISNVPSKPRRSARPRIFLEEAPCIDLDAALRTGTPDEVHLMWEKWSTGGGELFGEGVLSIIRDELNMRGTLEYYFIPENDDKKYIPFDVVETVNGVTGSRLRLICSECKRPKSKVYFRREKWMCQSCHGLLYRSQYKADIEPDYDLYDRLKVQTLRPRRPYERATVYAREVEKAKAKLARLGPIDDAQRTVSRPFAPITTGYYRGYPPE